MNRPMPKKLNFDDTPLAVKALATPSINRRERMPRPLPPKHCSSCTCNQALGIPVRREMISEIEVLHPQSRRSHQHIHTGTDIQ